jgi:hypothetical protein
MGGRGLVDLRGRLAGGMDSEVEEGAVGGTGLGVWEA